MTTTAFTFDTALVSDLHKDAYGFRPSASFWDMWNNGLSDEGRQAEWDYLCAAADRAVDEEKREQDRAYNVFADRVVEAMLAGAKDRDEAILWLVRSLDEPKNVAFYGAEWLCWEFGLSYDKRDMFANAVSVIKSEVKDEDFFK